MLTHIHIKNFVIVKSLSLDFQQGLHILTGETGAGKSIWIDAIEIGLGARADAQMIYPGTKACDITLCFNLQHQPFAKKWLEDNDFSSDDECIVRRVIDLEKPSRTTINGTPIPQQLIRLFAEHVLCIHGQHQHQQLLKADDQRDLLDHYAENQAILSIIQTCYDEWKSLDRQTETLKEQMKNKSSDLSLWQYQLDELKKLNIQINEYENLFSEFQQLHHAKQFSAALHETLQFLDNDENISSTALAQKSLQHIKTIRVVDSKIENIKSLLQTAVIHLNEAKETLQQYCDAINISENKLEQIESRLAALQDIARKHHVDPTQLLDIQLSLQDKIELLEKADEALLDLEHQKNKIISDYQKKSTELTKRREKAAKQLSAAITEQMQLLGMNGGVFKIDLITHNAPIHFHGNEQLRFLIATNPGQAPHDLSDIVSGGELSRLSLIMQVLTSERKNTPTLIFDEVDSGVGGKTATLVGKLLRELSTKAQVLCVTHLPQVAAHGHHHFFAEKISDGKTTSTAIRLLNEKERTTELARMLSGEKITEKSLEHASELLEQVL